jgi:hypothetical protein
MKADWMADLMAVCLVSMKAGYLDESLVVQMEPPMAVQMAV